jgi:alpha-tubulin suppressor-like RCC1 family protein
VDLGSDTTLSGLSAGASSPPLEDAVSLACGPNHTCAVMKDGGVKCWGANNAGQLGLGLTDGGTSPKQTKPTDVFPGGSATVTSICAGGLNHADSENADLYRGFTCALVSGGSGDQIVQCWGANDTAQLGNGTTSDTSIPTTVPELQGVSAVYCGGAHACAVIGQTEPKSLKCWGSNAQGQLGLGTSDLVGYFPADVTGL